jgi:hypothetical protein
VCYVSFVFIKCICLCILFVVPHCINAATGLTTYLESNNNNNNNNNDKKKKTTNVPLAKSFDVIW